MSNLPSEPQTSPRSESVMPAPPGWPAPEPPVRGRDPRNQSGFVHVLGGLLALGLVIFLILSLSHVVGPVGAGSGGAGTQDAATAGIVDINTFTRVYGHEQLVPAGAGSGMVLTPDGEVLTNNHVVQGAWKIEVDVPGGQTYTASVVGVAPSRDVALIQLSDASGLETISPGDATSVSVGDRVAGIGNALGRGGEPAVATGNVTAVNRTITASDPRGSSEQLSGMIQTNANIQPGDSGGALVDENGQVIGMITAGSDQTRTNNGPTAGFAIPINNALTLVDQIHTGTGDPSVILLGERGYLGVAVKPLDPTTGAQLGASHGAMVVGLDPNGPAETAGMTTPAVIIAVDGHAVTSDDDLGPLLHSQTPGGTVTVEWVDGSGSHTATVQLEAGPAV